MQTEYTHNGPWLLWNSPSDTVSVCVSPGLGRGNDYQRFQNEVA